MIHLKLDKTIYTNYQKLKTITSESHILEVELIFINSVYIKKYIIMILLHYILPFVLY